MINTRLPFFLLLLFVVVSCADPTEAGNQDSVPVAVVTNDPPNWDALLTTWADVMDDSDLAAQSSLYADTVDYYGGRTSAIQVFAMQHDYISSHPGYQLRVDEVDRSEQRPDSTWYIHFVKRVFTEHDTTEYPGSLIFARRPKGWKIIAESDDITDMKRSSANTILAYAPAVVTVEGIVEETTGSGLATAAGKGKSNARETYLVLVLTKPADVVAAADPASKNASTETNVTRLRLYPAKGVDLSKFLNKPVSLTGTLRHADVAIAHTAVVMDVRGVK